MNTRAISSALLLIALFGSAAQATSIVPVPLKNAVATYSQGILPVAQSIDGNLGPFNGWAIDNHENSNEAAAYQTVSNVSSPVSTFVFNLLNDSLFGDRYILRDFRISATTDSRSTFATNGQPIGGDVAATWTPLIVQTALATNGVALAIQGDNSIIASGGTLNTSDFTITATTSLSNITGFRLEVFGSPGSLSGLAANGNFVLTEFEVSVVTPEPSTFVLLGICGVAMVGYRLRLTRRSA